MQNTIIPSEVIRWFTHRLDGKWEGASVIKAQYDFEIRSIMRCETLDEAKKGLTVIMKDLGFIIKFPLGDEEVYGTIVDFKGGTYTLSLNDDCGDYKAGDMIKITQWELNKDPVD